MSSLVDTASIMLTRLLGSVSICTHKGFPKNIDVH